ncbi:PAS domain-containing protein [Aureimonas sp. OT7]|uniref:HWE histidine kinase domain-containing protein n=1 Tax=Aureimonas sp. OT7 TaxID=2816454 RepID=UPI001783FFED|nr:HWE histidine kinase domain-containing protein [Aureimonas sp. OT7]QOG07347.1 PAS domain-containing protein [Aureimonas sp. OT7]
MGAKVSGQPFALEYRTIDRSGDVHWVSAQGRCFHDALGNPIRFPGAIIDITQEKRRRNMQAALLRLGDEGVEQLGDAVDYSARSLAIIGETLELGQAGYAAITDDDRYFAVTAQWTDGNSPPIPSSGKIGRIERRLVDRLTQDGTLVVEDVHLHPATRDNIEVWQGLNVAAMIDMAVVEDGRVRIILFLFSSRPRNWDAEQLAFVRDILNRAWTYSRRRLAERQLIETETRLRLAQEAAEIGTLDYRPLSGAFDMDERCRAIFGIAETAEPTFPDDLLGSITPEDCPAVKAQVEKALASAAESLLDLQFRSFNRVDGGIRHVRLEAQTVAEEGRVVRFVGAVHDVTEERTGQEKQALMTRELRHRVNNTLAMVEGLAGLTMRRAATPQEGLEAFVARLAALREAHEILTTTSWTSAPLRAVVDRIMADRDVTKRIHYGGPDVPLSARQSLALSLTLFEMLSNAIRHGSLSGDTGTVDLNWSVSMTPSGPHLRMSWKEHGGPAVQPPRRFGLGLKLIRQSLPVEIGGTVELTFPPDGASLVIEAPVHLGQDEAEDR